jgi:hypothetical protein
MSDVICDLRCAAGALRELFNKRIELLELERTANKTELDEAYIAKKKAEVLIATLTLKMYLKDVKDLSIFSIQ